MGISETLAALTFFVAILVMPFLWVFYKKDIKFEHERLNILMRQKTDIETETIPFGTFCAIKRATGDTRDVLGTNYDVMSLFFMQKQVLVAMAVTSGLVIFTCLSAFLFRASRPEKLKTLPEFISTNNSVPWSVIILIASLIIFFITLTAAHRYKKGIEEKIELLKKDIE